MLAKDVKILLIASYWPLEELDKQNRAANLDNALEFRNHKGATKKLELLRCLSSKISWLWVSSPSVQNCKHPWHPASTNEHQKQKTIDEHGRIVEKDSLTHDQCFKWGWGMSVNRRLNNDVLLPCMFGSCIKRIVNWTLTAQKIYLGMRIPASKLITSQRTADAT